MMRSLWTAASGMNGQQLAVDTIANNMANVNTTAFKRERVEFQSLLYQTIQGAGQNPEIVGNRPANLQVGHGVRPVASTRNFTMGTLEPTGSSLDFAVNGSGFFTVDRGNGNIAYTKDGSFKASPIGGGDMALVNNEGFFILDNAGAPITFPDTINIQDIAVNASGQFTYRDAQGEIVDMGVQFGMVQFSNKQGLESIGGNLFIPTAASGDPMVEELGNVGQISNIIQGHLERSNVQIAEEMVNLIVSQRAFEMNSRVVQTSDQMLQEANNMRR